MTAQTTKIMSGIIIPAATAPRDDLDELLAVSKKIKKE